MRTLPLIAGAALVAGLVGVLAPNAAVAATTRYEAETSPAVCTGTIDSNWPGFSGSGFCNGTNATNAYAQFTVNASAAGSATLAVRFANGTTTSRPTSLIVNGSTVQSPTFEATSAWDSWATKTLTVNLNAGDNTVRLNPTGSGGLPNIDYVEATTGGTTPPPAGDTLYVAPNGTDGAAGTISSPTTLTSAISRIAAGGTIYLRGGTYNYSQTISIPSSNNGTSSARKTLSSYQGETPVLNFSAMAVADSNRGLALNGSYWHLYGLVVQRAGDNGIFVGGSNNIIERTVTAFNRDSGLQLSRMSSDTPQSQWPSNNLILSAESHDNADPDGEDALSYNNGTLSDGSQAGAGDRNGFKLGGEDISVNHTIRRDIAFNNGKHGFTYNRNLGTLAVSSNVSIDNTERNFNFDGGSSVFSGNTSCRSGSGTNDRIIGSADSSNQFWSGTNGSRCSSYSGALHWSFASDGHLVVTFGGTLVTP